MKNCVTSSTLDDISSKACYILMIGLRIIMVPTVIEQLNRTPIYYFIILLFYDSNFKHSSK